jgi:hypothetical protein
MSFESDIIRFTNKSEKEADKIRRAVIIKLFSSVVDDTPVDTGRLRGNWLTSVNKPRDEVLIQNDKNGNYSKNKILNNLGKFGDKVHFTNNLPYAKVAEYGEWNGPTDKVNSSGFSKKSPRGMVRKNAIRFQKILKNLANKI